MEIEVEIEDAIIVLLEVAVQETEAQTQEPFNLDLAVELMMNACHGNASKRNWTIKAAWLSIVNGPSQKCPKADSPKFVEVSELFSDQKLKWSFQFDVDVIRNYAIIEPRPRSTVTGRAGQIAKMSSTIPPSSAVSHRKRAMETRVAKIKLNFLSNDLASERACVTQKRPAWIILNCTL